MTEKLKPCPFCGGEAEVETIDASSVSDDLVRVRCQACGVKTRSEAYCLGDEAIEHWNTRPVEAEVARLRDALESLPDYIELFRLIRRSKERKHVGIAKAIADRLDDLTKAALGQTQEGGEG